MKKGYSLVEFLIGLILSFLVLDLALSGFKYVQLNQNDYTSQDLISSFQLHQILNTSIDIIVDDQEINFMYLNEERSLQLINNKLILKPGTVIYYLDVENCSFYIQDDKIYLKLLRKNKESLFLIGLVGTL